MRKAYIFFYLLIFIVSDYFFFSQSKIISNTKLENVIEPKLYSEKILFKKAAKKQFLEDFEAFVYFFSTSYIAYDEMVESGFALEDFIFSIRNKIEKDLIKTSDELIKNIYDELKRYICDSHFVIASQDCVYNFNPNLLGQKTSLSNGFEMTTNSNSIYLNLSIFLPEFFSENLMAKEYFEKVYAEFKNIQKKKYLIIDLRNCPGGVTDYPLLLLYSLYMGTELVIPSKIYDAWHLESETIYRTSKSIETPVTESLRYQRAIYTEGNKFEENFRTSLVMQIKNPKRIVRGYNSKIAKEIHKPAYQGKIIFLTNNKTASAAESLILFGKNLFSKNIKIIGENTMGCLTYIDVFQIIMPNNSFAVSMAFKSIEESLKLFDCWKGECIGIQPDIICSDEDVLPILKKITKDKKLRFENDEK